MTLLSGRQRYRAQKAQHECDLDVVVVLVLVDVHLVPGLTLGVTSGLIRLHLNCLHVLVFQAFHAPHHQEWHYLSLPLTLRLTLTQR